MRKSRFTETQVLALLKEVDTGMKVRELYYKHGVAENKFRYCGIGVRGEATLEAVPDLMPLPQRLAQRYMGEEPGGAYAETFAEDVHELVRLRPDTVWAWNFRNEH